MKYLRIPVIALALVLLVMPLVANLQEPERPVFVAREILLQFRPDVSQETRRNLIAAHGLQVIRALRVRDKLILKLRIPKGADPRELADRLRSLPEIEAAEPNYFRYLHGVPNDPRFGELWGLNNTGQTGGTVDADVDAPEAWNIASGSPNVVVAVIDSGMDTNHPDLVANLYTNPNEVANGIDDDGNGFIDDIHGWDFRDNDSDPFDPNPLCASHGTHTAGTVGAVGNNSLGVTGVAQTVKIMPLRVFYVFLIFCTAQDSDLIEAMDYMAHMNVPISNNSWGGGPFSQLIASAVARTRGLFVTSAGNAGSNNDVNPSYPASYDLENIVAVAATTHNDVLAGFSNFGNQSVDIAAPGEAILSTIRGGDYGLLSGTSMAAPHVAGAAAVLLGRDPTLTAHELRAKLLRSVDPKGLPVATGGRLNLLNALNLPPSAVTITVTPLGPTDISPGDTIYYSVSVTNTSATTHVVNTSVRVWSPSGDEFVRGPRSLTLAPSETVNSPFNIVVMHSVPPGNYRLIGRVENTTDTFDESQVMYHIQ